MTWPAHADAAATVRAHWQEAELFLVAHRDPCIRIRDEEIAAVDRLIHGGVPDDLVAWNRPSSWSVAVLVCPGDDLSHLTDVVEDHDLDPARFHFYMHPEADTEQLGPWAVHGFPLDQVDTEGHGGRPIDDWKTLHKLLGLHFNLQILHDFA